MKTFAAITLLLCSSAFAAPEREQEPPPRHGPPPEALAACKGKAEGSTAELTTPRGEKRQGTCHMVLVIEHEGPPKR
jgi:hypothetical protein